MKSDILEDVILFDWLTVSYKSDDPDIWKSILGMESVDWVPLDHGRNGYKAGYYFGSISILYDGTEDMGVCLDMSGQGCRSFEEFGSGDYIGLFALISSDPGFHITRLDVAFDDHSGILDIDQLFNDSEDKLYISKFRVCRLEKQYIDDRCGITVYHGSKKSDVLIRIYDKAAERGLPEFQHWIRVELQLRNDRALEFIQQEDPVGIVFRGVLFNYVRYVEEGSDSNRWRWPLKSYWEQLLAGAERIRLFVTPGIEYNVARLDHFVFDMAGPALKCACDLYGAPFVVKRILDHDISDNTKYQKLIKQFRQKK